MEPILECRHLYKKYAEKNALNDFTISFPRGKVIGLLGPNGSGKTTLIKLASGLLQPTSGDVLINGIAPCTQTKAVVSYLPERPYFNSWMTVKGCIDFFADFYADFDTERAYKMLASLQVDPEAKLKTLSKGTKEKVQLILVMARNAELFLLDEPIAGVDPAARDYILDTIIANRNPDSTVIISTHLIADIEKVLDEFVFIHAGIPIRYNSVENLHAATGKSVDELFREVFRCF